MADEIGQIGLTAIPCVLYINTPLGERKKIMKLLSELDDDAVPVKKLGGVILPDFSREPYQVGSYNTPGGPAPYKAKLVLEYTDPAEADPDTPAGTYELDVFARNSFEAAERAFDKFHRENPIKNLDAIEMLDIKLTRVVDPQ